jgi:DmsE family decaheme c-type cytochrome
MERLMTRPNILQPLALLLVVACSAAMILSPATIARAEKSKAEPDSPQRKYRRQTDPSLYVGAETCKTCHEDIFKNFETTPHFVTTFENKRGPEWQGCEACHGSGKEHVESGGDKTKIFTFKAVSAQATSEPCLDCHTYGEEHSNFARSAHLQNNVGCIDCHSPHHAKESQRLMKEKQPQLCYGCHLEAKQQFNRPFHHRVNEGMVQCSDCHNPHGGFQTRQLRATPAQDVACQVPLGESRALCA